MNIPNIPEYISLSDLCKKIENVITKEFQNYYWIKAEIAKLNYYPASGHCYPELVEKQENKVIAEIRGIIWSNTFNIINKKFQEQTGEKLKEGISVLLLVKPNYSTRYGLSLYITDIFPSFTLGEMLIQKRKTIERLKKEGIFDNNKKLSVPLLPKKLAIISVETSKGYNDFKNIISNNLRKYVIEHDLFPAILQGENAIESITNQLDNIRLLKDKYDVVLIIRGGGGDIGLACYDSYEIASRIATFPLPVFTGIGHSTNETIADMVANQNKITPTELAHYILSFYENFENKIIEIKENIIQKSTAIISDSYIKLGMISDNIVKISTNKLMSEKSSLNVKIHKISFIANKITNNLHNRLNFIQTYIKTLTITIIQRDISVIKNIKLSLESATKRIISSNYDLIKNIEKQTEILNPKNILKRGYSITYYQGRVVKNPEELKKGDVIRTEFFEGQIDSKIL